MTCNITTNLKMLGLPSYFYALSLLRIHLSTSQRHLYLISLALSHCLCLSVPLSICLLSFILSLPLSPYACLRVSLALPPIGIPPSLLWIPFRHLPPIFIPSSLGLISFFFMFHILRILLHDSSKVNHVMDDALCK